jgi:transposase
MGERKTRRSYDRSFKTDAVRMVVEGQHPVAEVARDLGLDRSMLSRWVRELTVSGVDSFPGHGKLSPQDEELRRLKRELERVTEERDILKKAMGVFSRRP